MKKPSARAGAGLAAIANKAAVASKSEATRMVKVLLEHGTQYMRDKNRDLMMTDPKFAVQARAAVARMKASAANAAAQGSDESGAKAKAKAKVAGPPPLNPQPVDPHGAHLWGPPAGPQRPPPGAGGTGQSPTTAPLGAGGVGQTQAAMAAMAGAAEEAVVAAAISEHLEALHRPTSRGQGQQPSSAGAASSSGAYAQDPAAVASSSRAAFGHGSTAPRHDGRAAFVHRSLAAAPAPVPMLGGPARRLVAHAVPKQEASRSSVYVAQRGCPDAAAWLEVQEERSSRPSTKKPRRHGGRVPEPMALAEAPKPRREAYLGGLSGELTAMIMSYIDMRTKVAGVRRVSTPVGQALQCRVAWDPLHLDQVAGKAFLRLLKRRDPLGCFAADVGKTKCMFPKGLFEVRHLEAVLMDPERVELEQSDTEDDTPKQRPLVIADPLDEVCKRLRHYFTSVNELAISNIEDYRMDYRFVGLRAGCLGEFGFVELVHRDTNPPTYALRARRDSPPRVIDIEAAKAENLARLPHGLGFDDATTISEREALYLAEHRSAYKNGDDFHLVHAFYRTVRSHGVRKRYKPVIDYLRKRFPQQFKSRADPRSPCRSYGYSSGSRDV